MAGFATDATHVSSSGTPLAQTGIANAFANATNLADITTGDALDETPAGNADAPQSMVNTLADILASCINSTGPASTPCSTLLSTALSSGSSGTQPTDTAAAAINIAHNPAPNVATLYGLLTADAPFQPTLSSAPDNFTVVLFITGGGVEFPWGIAVDASGNIWTANSYANNVSEFSSLGAPLTPSAGFTSPDMIVPMSIAIDSLGNAWTANYYGGSGQSETYSVTKLSPSGAVLSGNSGFTGGGLNTPFAIAIDAADNAWVANYTPKAIFIPAVQGVTEFSNSGVPLSPANTGFNGGGIDGGASVAIDNSGNVWTGNGLCCGVSELSNSGAPISPVNPTGGGFTNGSVSTAFGIAIDASGNVWTANGGASVSQYSNSGVPISPSGGYQLPLSVSQEPRAIAIDGAGDAWIADYKANSIVELAPSGSFLSSPVGYTSNSILYPTGIAVDAPETSGWLTACTPASPKSSAQPPQSSHRSPPA